MSVQSRNLFLLIFLSASAAADPSSKNLGFEGTEFQIHENVTQEKSNEELLKEVQDKYESRYQELKQKHRRERDELYKSFEKPTAEIWHTKKNELTRRQGDERFELDQEKNAELCAKIRIKCPKKNVDHEIKGIKNKDAIKKSDGK